MFEKFLKKERISIKIIFVKRQGVKLLCHLLSFFNTTFQKRSENGANWFDINEF